MLTSLTVINTSAAVIPTISLTAKRTSNVHTAVDAAPLLVPTGQSFTSSSFTPVDAGTNNQNRMVFGDFDNDGDADVISQAGANTVGTYYENDGAGAFSAKSSRIDLSAVDIAAKGTIAVDLDHDGDLDIYV